LDSNQRPSGYEPDELPLLHPASRKGLYPRGVRRVKCEALAPAYFPTQLPAQYRERWGVSLPCSGWERVGPPRSRHQGQRTPPKARGLRHSALGTPAGLGAGRIRRGVPEPSCAERWIVRRSCRPGVVHELGDEPSAISTATLKLLPALHARPINQVVYLGPYPINSVGTLIFGRASRLDAFSGYPCRTSATQRCPWRDNWYTGGPSVPVLSY
jgi:hypothetical protein